MSLFQYVIYSCEGLLAVQASLVINNMIRKVISPENNPEKVKLASFDGTLCVVFTEHGGTSFVQMLKYCAMRHSVHQFNSIQLKALFFSYVHE